MITHWSWYLLCIAVYYDPSLVCGSSAGTGGDAAWVSAWREGSGCGGLAGKLLHEEMNKKISLCVIS